MLRPVLLKLSKTGTTIGTLQTSSDPVSILVRLTTR